MTRHKVLSTKKLGPSLTGKASAHGIDLVEKEFISITPVWNKATHEKILELARQDDLYIALTSANAVDVLNNYLAEEGSVSIISRKIFCLSGKTKKAVQSARLLKPGSIVEADNATTLGKMIVEEGIRKIVFFCGNKRRDELPGLLKDAGVEVLEIVLYETGQTPDKLTGEFDAVLFFSPSGVQSFFSVNELNSDTVCFAIGPTTAASISTFAPNLVMAPIAPDPEVLLDKLIEHFKNKVERENS